MELFYFAGNGTFLYFLKKRFSYISRKIYSEPWYIQNPNMFRTESIFGTMSNFYDGTYCKNS